MRLEDYFDFLAADDIRLKGHRLGIETILLQYLHRGKTPEQIAALFDTVSLEQIYATILYYFQHRTEVDAYLNDYLAYTRQARRQQQLNPPPAVARIQQLVEQKSQTTVA